MAPPLLSLRDAKITFGERPLFRGITLNISKGDRLCLVGRNGAGKSTLLKAISGDIELDEGTLFINPGSSVAYLDQEPDMRGYATALDFAIDGLEPHEAYRAESLFLELGIDPALETSSMSGGESRRVALTQALIRDPDILLLDEPTNHLDLSAIEWLEDQLKSFSGGLVVISHDRFFLNRVTNATFWLDRGEVKRSEKGFEFFEQWSEDLLEKEDVEQAKLDKLIAEETRWSRQGISARRKRNQGRLRRLYDLREQRQSHVSRTGTAALDISSGKASGVKVIEAKNISKSFGERMLLNDFSIRIQRGDKIGFVGPNGAGKTTLLKMLIGDLEPDEGTVIHGTKLTPVYLDQKRETLDENATVWQTLCPDGGDQIMVRDRPRHVVSYMEDFLFSAKQARTPIKALSGGERNRLTLARSLAKPCNLLILDEPTNDLDMETLDLLQEMLSDYDGVLLLVSHDRDFLDRTVTSTIVMDGDGSAIEYAGGYSDAMAQAALSEQPLEDIVSGTVKSAKTKQSGKQKKKLTYKDQRALEVLPQEIEALNEEVAALQAKMADATFFTRDPDGFHKATTRLTATQADISAKEEQWLEVEMMREELNG